MSLSQKELRGIEQRLRRVRLVQGIVDWKKKGTDDLNRK
jgi:hypothetical protein